RRADARPEADPTACRSLPPLFGMPQVHAPPGRAAFLLATAPQGAGRPAPGGTSAPRRPRNAAKAPTNATYALERERGPRAWHSVPATAPTNRRAQCAFLIDQRRDLVAPEGADEQRSLSDPRHGAIRRLPASQRASTGSTGVSPVLGDRNETSSQ